METIALVLLIAIATIGAIGIGTATQSAQAFGFTRGGNDNSQGNENGAGGQQGNENSPSS